MRTALFTNFTDEEFIGYWDGKGKKIIPGQSIYMPDYLAKHFALHLVNRELLKRKPDGTLLIPNGDKYVSPKKPEDVPVFMDLFNKAFAPDELDELGEKRDDIDTLIDVANKNRGNDQRPAPVDAPAPKEQSTAPKQDPTKPQVITPPDFDDDDDSEESFQGKPVETVPATQAPTSPTPEATTPPVNVTQPAPPLPVVPQK